ncbi:MAG: WS/DGAT domain-containing protein, partial [Gammaproteobacteria bacterium]|nr:WS/DGAT domain-containing protein [Gammaproteobacteria bacterium]
NQVTMMMVSFASDEADPLQRLYKIASSSGQAKHFTADVAASYDTDIAVPGLPAMLSAGAGMAERLRFADFDGVRMPCNVVVSNVPGPQMQLYSNGARMVTHYPVSIPAHGQGVNITVQSYTDEMFFAITACAKALPDAGLLREDMLAAFEELRAAVAPSAATQQEVTEIAPAKRPATPERATTPQPGQGNRAA